MLAVYSQAQEVVVWLGEHGTTSPAALSCITPGCQQYFGERTPTSLPASSNWLFLGDPLGPGDPLEHEAFEAHVRLCRRHYDTLRNGMRDLFSRAWFQRVWTKQEVWAAANVNVQLGDECVAWNDLRAFTHNYRVFTAGCCDEGMWPDPFSKYPRERELDADPPWSPDVPQMLNDQDRKPRQEDRELVQVLARLSGSASTDKRDAVYGALGMTQVPLSHSLGNDEPHMTVDYHKSAAEIYQEVVRYYIQRDRSLDVLDFFKTLGGTVDEVELPSWCPNFSRRSHISVLMGRTQPNDRTQHFFLQQRRVPVDVAVSWRQLRVRGVLVGIVDSHDNKTCFKMKKHDQNSHVYEISRATILSHYTDGGRIFYQRSGASGRQSITSIGDNIIVAEGSAFPFLLRPRPADRSSIESFQFLFAFTDDLYKVGEPDASMKRFWEEVRKTNETLRNFDLV